MQEARAEMEKEHQKMYGDDEMDTESTHNQIL